MGTAWVLPYSLLCTEFVSPCVCKATGSRFLAQHRVAQSTGRRGSRRRSARLGLCLPRCGAGAVGAGSGSCHSEEQGLLRHKEVFDRGRQSRSESRPRAGSRRARPLQWERVPSTQPQASAALLGDETRRMFRHYRISRGVIFEKEDVYGMS